MFLLDEVSQLPQITTTNTTVGRLVARTEGGSPSLLGGRDEVELFKGYSRIISALIEMGF